MDAVGPPYTVGVTVFLGLVFQDLMEFLLLADQDFSRVLHHKAHGRILDIIGSQTFMDVFGSIADMFSHRSKQRNDIMVGRFFDLMDPIQIEVRFRLDIVERVIRDDPQFVHRFTGSDLDFDNVAVFVFLGPDRTHFLTCITWNHNTSSLR